MSQINFYIWTKFLGSSRTRTKNRSKKVFFWYTRTVDCVFCVFARSVEKKERARQKKIGWGANQVQNAPDEKARRDKPRRPDGTSFILYNSDWDHLLYIYSNEHKHYVILVSFTSHFLHGAAFRGRRRRNRSDLHLWGSVVGRDGLRATGHCARASEGQDKRRADRPVSRQVRHLRSAYASLILSYCAYSLVA